MGEGLGRRVWIPENFADAVCSGSLSNARNVARAADRDWREKGLGRRTSNGDDEIGIFRTDHRRAFVYGEKVARYRHRRRLVAVSFDV